MLTVGNGGKVSLTDLEFAMTFIINNIMKVKPSMEFHTDWDVKYSKMVAYLRGLLYMET
jgi:hypothetical protein